MLRLIRCIKILINKGRIWRNTFNSEAISISCIERQRKVGGNCPFPYTSPWSHDWQWNPLRAQKVQLNLTGRNRNKEYDIAIICLLQYPLQEWCNGSKYFDRCWIFRSHLLFRFHIEGINADATSTRVLNLKVRGSLGQAYSSILQVETWPAVQISLYCLFH